MARAINLLVIHCADTKPSMDIGAKEIDRWHRARGWLKIGYHYVIRRDGTLETGRNEDEVGAHVEGFNTHSIGICMVGGMTEDGKGAENNFTDQQWGCLHSLLESLRDKYPQAEIKGHYQLNPGKQCPVFDVPKYLKDHPV